MTRDRFYGRDASNRTHAIMPPDHLRTRERRCDGSNTMPSRTAHREAGTTMRIPVLALASVGASLAMSISVIAAPESKRGNADLKTYCTGDALTFCGGIDSNSPAMDACFEKNMGKLSENCRRAITAYKAAGGK